MDFDPPRAGMMPRIFTDFFGASAFILRGRIRVPYRSSKTDRPRVSQVQPGNDDSHRAAPAIFREPRYPPDRAANTSRVSGMPLGTGYRLHRSEDPPYASR